MAQPNTATANRSERIAEIVAKRQPLAQRIISVESNLTALGNVIKVLENNRQQQLEQWANDPKIVANLEKVNFATILGTIKKELQDLRMLEDINPK